MRSKIEEREMEVTEDEEVRYAKLSLLILRDITIRGPYSAHIVS